ncbi:FRG domain-containing protein [Paenibacillus peoriae]|uniref:FRG domain-containing protein n=1 Tax=Paenibacillus peoriae TaxID=59893 RepID=UPI002117277C|nr:FRG domain-containing protein [Paenibacillus peoriae]
MSTVKEVKVSSLSDYIKLFSDGRFANCIFRGEPTNYHETVSSALREYRSGFENSKVEYPFIKMKNDFKREVWHKLSQDERTNFLAFAQHHGIPTNLIDFTTSPLVALYFSCQPYQNREDENFNESKSFIYILQNKIIDITDIIAQNEDANILELFIQNKRSLLINFYECFCRYEKEYPLDFYKKFKLLNKDWHYYFGKARLQSPFKSKFPAYNGGDYKKEILLSYDALITDENKSILKEIEEKYEETSFEVLFYTLYLQKFLTQIKKEHAEPVWWIDCMPNFMYSPILSFERGRNQQGLFIYQTYLSFKESVYNTPILSQQRTWADTIIVVENKDEILKELDFMGINKKFIYGDYDNIASYIKQRYQ